MILISIAFNFLAIAICIYRTKNPFNIFSIVNMLFMICGIVYLFDPLLESGSVFRTLSVETIIYVSIFSFCFMLINFRIRPPAEAMIKRGEILCVFGNPVLFFAISFVVISATFLLVMKNGMKLPIVIISESFRSGKGAHYSEFDIPFVTPLAIGLSRVPFILLACNYLFSRDNLVRHIKRHWVYYIIAGICTVTVLASGRRNVILWPILYFVVVYTIKQRISFKKAMVIGVFFLGFSYLFSVIGDYRSGAVDRSSAMGFLKQPVDVPVLGPAWAWMARYSGASYSNLNVMIEYPMEPTYGTVLLTELVPDIILDKIMVIPQEPVVYMSDNRLLPYFGNTFRTFFADVYSDFGYIGSLLLGASIYGICVYLFNGCGYNWRLSYLFLVFLPGLFMFPFLNQFTGLSTLSALLFLPFIKYKSYG